MPTLVSAILSGPSLVVAVRGITSPPPTDGSETPTRVGEEEA